MKEDKCDGYISKITFGGKVYKLKCEIVEVHPMTCPKCGGQLELHYGTGKCEYCGTHYSTNFIIKED